MLGSNPGCLHSKRKHYPLLLASLAWLGNVGLGLFSPLTTLTFNDVADALKVARVDGSTGQVSEISVMFKLVPVSLLEIVSLEPKMSKQILYHLKG